MISVRTRATQKFMTVAWTMCAMWMEKLGVEVAAAAASGAGGDSMQRTEMPTRI